MPDDVFQTAECWASSAGELPTIGTHQQSWTSLVGRRIVYDRHPEADRHIWQGDAKHRK